tara:strand:- start:6880 stop:7533 length:654 start_codon:yes stop_codon:yes gene_type:complete
LITLFGNLESGNVHKVQLILKFCEKEFTRVDVSQVRSETSQPGFLSINPIGKIPAIITESGDVLSESNAILYYFGSDTSLWPAGRRNQAEVLRWMFFEQYSHEPTLSVIRYLKNFTEHPDQHSEQIRLLTPKAERALDTLENRLGKSAWVAASTCTIADYALYPYTKLANEAGFDLRGYPAIESWLEHLESQPRFIALNEEGAVYVATFEEYFDKPV